MQTIEFDVTNENDFKQLARNFGRVLAVVEAEARKPIPYGGKNLYHPFLIAVQGPPAAGKSTFIEQAALSYADIKKPDGLKLVSPLKKLWPDAAEHRDVKIWMRWPFVDEAGNRFEIRSDDRMAVDCLYDQHPDVSLPTIEIPHIRFREWPDDDFLRNGRIDIDISYGYTSRKRSLKISIDPALEVDRIFEILRVAPCLTSSISIANEPAPA